LFFINGLNLFYQSFRCIVSRTLSYLLSPDRNLSMGHRNP
jgi:hypothetical protein